MGGSRDQYGFNDARKSQVRAILCLALHLWCERANGRKLSGCCDGGSGRR